MVIYRVDNKTGKVWFGTKKEAVKFRDSLFDKDEKCFRDFVPIGTYDLQYPIKKMQLVNFLNEET